MAIQFALISVAYPDSCAFLATVLSPFPITTVMECTDPGETFWLTLMLGCFSWTSKTQSEYGSTAPRRSVRTTLCAASIRVRCSSFVSPRHEFFRTALATSTNCSLSNTRRMPHGRITLHQFPPGKPSKSFVMLFQPATVWRTTRNERVTDPCQAQPGRGVKGAGSGLVFCHTVYLYGRTWPRSTRAFRAWL